ncbi:MAG: putative DNA modification/repair radical SAM protein [Planctomycetota bacterium]
MDIREKLSILADAAKYDASCASSGSKTRRKDAALGSTEGIGICHSYTPDGRCVSLLKILLTNYCVYDCQYCVNRISSDTPRARFTVDEVVSLTMDFYRRNYIEGLFLSSGIIRDSDYTMDLLVQVAKKLRQQQRYGGYIHLKTIPNASQELIDQAGLFADRLSVNIELPTDRDLVRLAPEKKKPQIVESMGDIQQRIDESKSERAKGFKSPVYAPAGQSTQMIVGATPTPDQEILRTASELYGQRRLRRVYYSAYSPIPHADARLPGQSPPLVREHRLYQADWLLRFYDFRIDEIVTQNDRNLSLDHDPKMAWALANRESFPIDVNKAERKLLLRVPGLGVRNVNRILSIRRHQALRVADLKKLRVAWNRMKHFVCCLDHHPGMHLDSESLPERVKPKDRQLLLFEAAGSAASGEV